MNFKDLRLFALLGLLLLSNTAADIGDLFGFNIFEDPECDCEEDQTLKVLLSPAKLTLVQGEAGTVTAEFYQGMSLKEANWSMQQPSARVVGANSLSTASGSATTVSVTASSTVIPDQKWDQGTTFETASSSINAAGKNQEGAASAVLTVDVWGTQFYWANEDGSVRTWWDKVKEGLTTFNPFGSGLPQRGSISDGGDSVTYFLKMNVPGGLDSADWDFEVKLGPVQSQTLVDSVIPVYDPFGSVNQPSQYVQTPQVVVQNGVLKLTFKSVQDFPEWGFSGSSASMPYEIVAKRKSDGLTVRKGSNLELFDDPFSL